MRGCDVCLYSIQAGFAGVKVEYFGISEVGLRPSGGRGRGVCGIAWEAVAGTTAVDEAVGAAWDATTGAVRLGAVGLT